MTAVTNAERDLVRAASCPLSLNVAARRRGPCSAEPRLSRHHHLSGSRGVWHRKRRSAGSARHALRKETAAASQSRFIWPAMTPLTAPGAKPGSFLACPERGLRRGRAGFGPLRLFRGRHLCPARHRVERCLSPRVDGALVSGVPLTITVGRAALKFDKGRDGGGGGQALERCFCHGGCKRNGLVRRATLMERIEKAAQNASPAPRLLAISSGGSGVTSMTSAAPSAPSQTTFAKTRARIFYLGYLTLLGALDARAPDGAPNAALVLERAQKAGLMTCVDLVSIHHAEFQGIVDSAAPFIDYLVTNEIEAARAMGADSAGAPPTDAATLTELAKGFLAKGVRKAAIIHCVERVVWLGAEGAALVIDVTPLPPEEIASNLGAGDAFCAGLLYALHEGRAPHQAIALATAVAKASLKGLTATSAIRPLSNLSAARPTVMVNGTPETRAPSTLGDKQRSTLWRAGQRCLPRNNRKGPNPARPRRRPRSGQARNDPGFAPGAVSGVIAGQMNRDWDAAAVSFRKACRAEPAERRFLCQTAPAARQVMVSTETGFRAARTTSSCRHVERERGKTRPAPDPALRSSPPSSLSPPTAP
jgi:sugar/nucleoside kinase (ribokinase family)